MNRHKRFLNRMVVFVLAVGLLLALLIEPISRAFLANPLLNGVIAAVLVVGVVYAFRQVLMLRPEADWLAAYRRGEPETAEQEPVLLGPVAAMLGRAEAGERVRMNAISMRTLLDGVASRLEEGREILRYLTRLLIFLGLLGTFWGLLAVLAAIGDTIAGLSVESADIMAMFDALKAGLERPLDGMAIAFSSSLFGLAGSVVLGFLDLQAGQAQNRFYNDLEDWLSSVARVTRAGPAVAAPEEESGAAGDAYLSALLEQTADSVDELRRSIEKAESSRADANMALTRLSEGLSALTDQMRSDQTITRRLTDAQTQTQRTFEKLLETDREGGLDDASREHLRNMDISLKRLIEEQSKAADATAEAMRGEMKLLSRTIATALEGRRKAGRSEGA